jgi:hypothetical protein
VGRDVRQPALASRQPTEESPSGHGNANRTVREKSHIDDMRSAIRGDFERLAERRGSQELMRAQAEEPEPQPQAVEVEAEVFETAPAVEELPSVDPRLEEPQLEEPRLEEPQLEEPEPEEPVVEAVRDEVVLDAMEEPPPSDEEPADEVEPSSSEEPPAEEAPRRGWLARLFGR